jgi:hypothetical protein
VQLLSQPFTLGAAPPAAESIDRLIQQLADASFTERQRALEEIDRQGEAAVPALRRAVALDPDAEVRWRAEEALQRIERRLDADRLLRSRLVRLELRDVSIPDAVAAFARQTGMRIQLQESDRTRLARKKITLLSDEIPCWEALEQLCYQAGLIERSGTPNFPSRGPSSSSDPAGRRPGPDGEFRPRGPASPGGLTLTAGTPALVPTTWFGALRIRQLSFGVNAWQTTREIQFQLAVDIESQLLWRRVTALRIEHARDEQDRELVQRNVFLNDAASRDTAQEESSRSRGGPDRMRLASRQATVTLEAAPTPSRRLKELRGVLAVQIETPLEQLLAVEDLDKQKHVSIRGSSGASVRVLEVEQEADRQYRVRFRVTLPGAENADAIGARVVRFNRTFRERRNFLTPSDLEERGLLVLDAQGTPLSFVTGECVPDAEGHTQEYTLYYLPRAEQGVPSRLILKARCCVCVEVPFTLKDVPLP